MKAIFLAIPFNWFLLLSTGLCALLVAFSLFCHFLYDMFIIFFIFYIAFTLAFHVYIAFKTWYYVIEALSTLLNCFIIGLGGSLMFPVTGSIKAPMYMFGLFLDILPKWG